jgi:flavin-dependent dehydrogenase
MDRYDVAILGGGLAGLTLGLQLKKARPDTSIFTAEKRSGPAPLAAFKVGESTVEMSAHYFSQVVGMKDHMDADQLPKAGLRFFFPSGDNTDISKRTEWGAPRWPPVPAYQLDRGRFENELAARNLAVGVDLVDGARVQGIELSGHGHQVSIERDGETRTISARWVVDATGRAFLLKRKLGLEQDNDHNINSSWLRLEGGLDIESFSDDEQWLATMMEPGLRKFSTNHMMGEGYWVWLIPLSSGAISIGIVADPRFHPWEEISTLDAAIDWLKRHEPQVGNEIDARRDQIADFLKVENFSYKAKQVYSPDRWCLTGEAGVFLDPLYSPGSDFIALSNTFITDAITRDLGGEDVSERIQAFNQHYLDTFDIFERNYLDNYEMFGDAQVMGVRLHWDYSFYWAYKTLWFFQKKWTDLDFLEAVAPTWNRAVSLQKRMAEHFFRQWHAIEGREWEGVFITIFPTVFALHSALEEEFDDAALLEKAERDLRFLEAFAVALFRKAAERLPDHGYDLTQPINPYAISLEPDRWEADGLFDGSGPSDEEIAEVTAGLEFSWLENRGAVPIG